MPQMMPINWLIIFLMCLLCLLISIILMNSLILFMQMKNKKMFFYMKNEYDYDKFIWNIWSFN